MLHLIQLLSILTVVCGSPWTRVTNGKNITIEESPYQVSISIGDFFLCGGSILSSRWILTACHCIKRNDSLVVRAGSTYNDRDGHTFNSKQLIRHPKYEALKFDYDVGLIDLGENAIPLDGTTMTPVQLPSSGLVIPGGTSTEIAGWGFIEPDGTSTNSLLGIDSTIMDHAECRDIINIAGTKVTDRMICTAPSDTTVCKGDSGSPLVLAEDKVQVGATSFGYLNGLCSQYELPPMFANIANPEIRTWIKDNTGI